VQNTICHKIYDKFSPATQPFKTQIKERIVDRIARQVLTRRGLDDLLIRDIDDDDLVWNKLGLYLINPPESSRRGGIKAIQTAFIRSRVMSNQELADWIDAINRWRNVGKAEGIANVLCIARDSSDSRTPILIRAEPTAGGERAGFSNSRFDHLVRMLTKLDHLHEFGAELKILLEVVGPVRRPIAAELADRSIVEQIGVETFIEKCAGSPQRDLMLAIADELEDLSHRDLAGELAVKLNEPNKIDRDDKITKYLKELNGKARAHILERVSKPGVNDEELVRSVQAILSQLLMDVAEHVYTSGIPGAEDNAELFIMLAESENGVKRE